MILSPNLDGMGSLISFKWGLANLKGMVLQKMLTERSTDNYSVIEEDSGKYPVYHYVLW